MKVAGRGYNVEAVSYSWAPNDIELRSTESRRILSLYHRLPLDNLTIQLFLGISTDSNSNSLGNPVRMEILQGLNGGAALGSSFPGALPRADDDTSD
jgi:hypothetical protein